MNKLYSKLKTSAIESNEHSNAKYLLNFYMPAGSGISGFTGYAQPDFWQSKIRIRTNLIISRIENRVYVEIHL